MNKSQDTGLVYNLAIKRQGTVRLYRSTETLTTALAPITVVFCIVIGFQRGRHANWQLVSHDGAAVQMLSDMGPKSGIATGGMLTLLIAAPPDGSSV